MPDTGRFYLLNVDGLEDRGNLLEVTRIDARCLSCQTHFRAVPGEGLVDHEGAGVITCPGCGNRQAISRARLQDFRRTA